MIKRTISEKIINATKNFPVVTLTGCRQSGKTTLLRALFPDFDHILLEEKDNREYAISDPRGFLDQFKNPVIIDEAQRAPDLFSYIQGIVDEENRPGQFILSGSQNFLLLEAITQSLAGRAAVFHLLPFSLEELRGNPGLDPLSRTTHNIPYENDLFETLLAGFYPRIHDKKVPPGEWLSNYYLTYVERDVRSITNVGDLESFNRFVGLCAGRTGQILDKTSLGNDAGVSQPTITRWLSILQAGFIIHILPPHYENFGKRLIKSPKLYFLDVGLLCYLLGIKRATDIRNHPQRGAIFESFVVGEMLKKQLHSGERPSLYYWRDSSKTEIDIMLEFGQDYVGYEIKSAQTFDKSFLNNLEKWTKYHKKQSLSAVIYGGDKSFSFKNHNVISWKYL